MEQFRITVTPRQGGSAVRDEQENRILRFDHVIELNDMRVLKRELERLARSYRIVSPNLRFDLEVMYFDTISGVWSVLMTLDTERNKLIKL
jgi:hypothetical protein